MKYLSLLIFSMLASTSVMALTSQEIADELNKMAPAKIDEITTLREVSVDNFDAVVYSYSLNVDKSMEQNVADGIARNRDIFRKDACSRPLTRNVLNMDKIVKYKYFLEDGTYLKTVVIGEYHCSKLGIPSPL